MWSQRADEAYKRLTRTISVPAGGATMSFWTSFNLELDFDYLIVEAHTVGQDDWTTLPDLNGHTSNDLSGRPVVPGRLEQPRRRGERAAPVPDALPDVRPGHGTCSNTGTTGAWNAANGSSSGWQQLQVDLCAYAGSQVELSITALSDWGLQQFPGVFIDDIEVSTGEGSTSFEDDGDPTDGWTVPGAPQDDAGFEGPNLNDWVRRGGLGIKEGAVVATDDTRLHGLRPRGHHRRRQPQRGDGAGDRLPPALSREGVGRVWRGPPHTLNQSFRRRVARSRANPYPARDKAAHECGEAGLSTTSSFGRARIGW